MTPILPPNPLQSLAYLKPGDRLLGATVTEAAPIIVRRKHDKAEVLYVKLDNGEEYCEHPGHGRRPMRDLASRVFEPIPFKLCSPMSLQLGRMENDAGFTFYPRQLDYVQHLAGAGSAMVAADVGTGKTLLAIALIHALQPRRCLVIAPQGVITAKGDMLSQWESEFARFAPWSKPVRVRSGYEAATSGAGIHLTYLQEALANDGGWLTQVAPDLYDMIVVDEAHLVQNYHTIMARALFRMQPRWRYALTATPVGNKVQDCLALLRWIRPDVDFGLPFHENLRGGARPLIPASPLLTYRALAHAVAPIRKQDIRPDLPPLHIHKVFVDPDPDTLAAYRDIEQNFTLKDGGAGQIERVRLTKLRNVCAGSIGKAVAIAEQIQLNPGVVVSARLEQTGLLVRCLKLSASSLRFGRIDSTVNPDNNPAVAAAFQRGELDVLMLGIKCAYGYSFPACDTIHVASLEWSWATFAQAVGRVWRVNSQRPVHAYVYLLRGTIEERMFDTVCAKQSAATLALYGEPLA